MLSSCEEVSVSSSAFKFGRKRKDFFSSQIKTEILAWFIHGDSKGGVHKLITVKNRFHWGWRLTKYGDLENQGDKGY